MNEDILNIVTKLEVLLTGIVASIIIFYFQKHFSKMFADKEKKDRRHIWIKFLSKYDTNIRDGFLHFQKLETPYENYKPFLPLIGLILGFFGFIILLYVISKYSVLGGYSIPVSICLYFGSIVFSLGILEKHKGKIDKSEKFLEQSEFVLNSITFIKWFTVSGSYLSALFIYLIYLKMNTIGESSVRAEQVDYLRDIYFLFFLGFSFWVMIITSTYSFRKDLLNHSKYSLNLKYLEKFPYARIKTMTSLDFQGKICDIFNENLIILDDNGVKKAAEWHSVNYFEVGEERFAFDYDR